MKKGFIALVLTLSSISGYAMDVAKYKARLLAMTNAQLYNEAANVRKTFNGKGWSGVGACYVAVLAAGASPACGSYAQVNYAGGTGYNGLPYSDTVPGTGCLAWKSSPTVPICWSGWASYSPSICTSSVQDNAANQMRIALNMSGDICKLSTFVPLAYPVTGGSLVSSLTIEWVTTAGKVNPKVCTVKRTINGIVYRNAINAAKCAKHYGIHLAQNDNATPPTISASDAQASILIGQLSSLQISNAISNLQSTLVSANQAVIDSKYNILTAGTLNGVALTTAQITALKSDIALAQANLFAAPTQDQIQDAIYVAAGVTPTNYVAPVAIAAPTTDNFATVNAQIATAAAAAAATTTTTTATTTTTTTNN